VRRIILKQKRLRKQLLDLLKIAVSLLLIIIILRSVDIGKLWEVLRQASPWFLLAALAVSFAGVVMRAYRWQILLHDQGVNATIRELTVLWFVSFLFTNLLPTGIGGDAVKMYELSQSSERGAEAVSSVLVDRFVGLFSLQAIGLLALIFSWRIVPTQIVILTLVVFGASLLAAWVVSYRRLWGWMARYVPFFDRLLAIKQVRSLVDSLQSYSPSALLRSFAVGLAFNVLLITMNVLIGAALGINVPIPFYMISVPLTSVVLILPISFAGLGVREATYLGLFSQVGVGREFAVTLSLMVYALGTMAPGIVGGVLYILRGARDAMAGADSADATPVDSPLAQQPADYD
jgi:uncharacterized protein (TIRG00374 family)